MKISDLALNAFCTYCWAEPGEKCKTSSGAPTLAHKDRVQPISKAWLDGFDEGVRDAVLDPAWAQRTVAFWDRAGA